jgi:hypothetical protein
MQYHDIIFFLTQLIMLFKSCVPQIPGNFLSSAQRRSPAQFDFSRGSAVGPNFEFSGGSAVGRDLGF